MGAGCSSFTKEAKDKMKHMLDQTRKTGLEHASLICEKDGKLNLSDVCIGGRHSVEGCLIGALTCSSGKKIGTFHTHPNYERFSDKDVLSSSAFGESFFCVGHDDKVKCVDPSKNKEILRPYKEYRDLVSQYRKTLRGGIKNDLLVRFKRRYSISDFKDPRYFYELLDIHKKKSRVRRELVSAFRREEISKNNAFCTIFFGRKGEG